MELSKNETILSIENLHFSYSSNRDEVLKGVNCDILGDSVIMKTEVEGDATLEINSAMRISGDFRKIFKKKYANKPAGEWKEEE